VDILQELTRVAEQAEVVHIRSESTDVGFEANRVKSATVQQTEGLAVRVVREGRLGFAATSDLSAEDRLVDSVLESARYGEQVPIAFPGPQDGPEVTTFDPVVAELPVARLVAMGEEIVDTVVDADPEVQVEIDLSRKVEHVSLRNQAGAEVSYVRSPLSVVIRATRVRQDDVLMVVDGVSATVWNDDYLAPARQLGTKLRQARESARLHSGRMPVLLAPRGALVLALPIMLGVDGKNVYRGASPMRGKAGEQLFDRHITIVDDATLDGRYASAPFDDEGVAHRRNVLIEEGVLQGFLYDLKTAAQAGAESTGNGSRSLFTAPSPSHTNLVWESGDVTLAELLGDIDEGLLVESPLGLGQGNVISGAFSNSLSLAYKIEKGEIVGRVKDVSIAGNVYDLLREVDGISQEREWVYGAYCLPYVLLPEVNVVAKQ